MFRVDTKHKHQYSLSIAIFGADDLSDTDLITEEKVKKLGYVAWNEVLRDGNQKRMGKTNKPFYEFLEAAQ